MFEVYLAIVLHCFYAAFAHCILWVAFAVARFIEFYFLSLICNDIFEHSQPLGTSMFTLRKNANA